MAYYKRIRDLREDNDKTQQQVAEYLGTTAQYYGKYEKGERELPFSRAIELAEFYDISLDYLAGRVSDINGLPKKDERNLLELFSQLTERNKGKAEFFIETLLRKQKK